LSLSRVCCGAATSGTGPGGLQCSPSVWWCCFGTRVELLALAQGTSLARCDLMMPKTSSMCPVHAGCLLLRGRPGEAWVDCRAVGPSGRPIPGEVGAVDGTALRWVQERVTENAQLTSCTHAHYTTRPAQFGTCWMQRFPAGAMMCIRIQLHSLGYTQAVLC
jgi:hypothetical protein